MSITPYQVAHRFIGIEELPGSNMANPMIMAFLQLDADWPHDDAVPWCSGFVNWCFWFAQRPRTQSLRARSWLLLGDHIPSIEDARLGDVVILNRNGPQDPDIIEAPGHVGFYEKHDDTFVHLLGGNQSNTVKVSAYDRTHLLGIRRIS